MFSFFKKEPSGERAPSSKLRVMGHDLDVVSITRNGKILFTGEVARNFPKDHLEGKVLEIAFRTGSGRPYFAYYLCHDYYCAVTLPGGAGYFGSPIEAALKAEEFRSTVSQAIMAFLVGYLKSALKIDASRDVASFSHNRAHTNTLSYVASLDDWFPIQHNDSESDDASERKVAAVNGGRCSIAEVIAVDQLSPSD
jgi:hypothetical protein